MLCQVSQALSTTDELLNFSQSRFGQFDSWFGQTNEAQQKRRRGKEFFKRHTHVKMTARLQRIATTDITPMTDRKWKSVTVCLFLHELVIRRWCSDDSLTHSPWTHLRTCRNRFCGSVRSHPVGRETTLRSGPWSTLGSRGVRGVRGSDLRQVFTDSHPAGCHLVEKTRSDPASGQLLLGGWRSRNQSRTDRASFFQSRINHLFPTRAKARGCVR